MSTGFFFRSRATKRPSPCLTTAAVKLLTFLALMSATLAHAQDFTFTTNNGTITITRYTGPGGDLTIPDTINGLRVAIIGGYATADGFNGAFENSRLTRVVIHNSVTNIGEAGFGECSGLSSITIPNGVPSLTFYEKVPILRSREGG